MQCARHCASRQNREGVGCVEVSVQGDAEWRGGGACSISLTVSSPAPPPSMLPPLSLLLPLLPPPFPSLNACEPQGRGVGWV
eukprot:2292180-Rhodomonas_salina.1